MPRSPLALLLLFAVSAIAAGCSASKSHEFRAARHVEIAKHAFILQAIEDCEIADTDERGRAKFETGRLMTAYIGHLSSFGWADRRNDEAMAREKWREIGASFPLFQSASVVTESGEAANRLPLLLDDEWVRIDVVVTRFTGFNDLENDIHNAINATMRMGLAIDSDMQEQFKFLHQYRTTGTITIEGPYGYASIDIDGTTEISEFLASSDGQRTAEITDLQWTLITNGEPIKVHLAPGMFDSRIVVNNLGLGEARLQVAFHSAEYPYLDDIYFNAILNIPVAASTDRRTIDFATRGSVRGTAVAPVMRIPTNKPTTQLNCADANANGIPDYIEAQNSSLEEVRKLLLDPI